MTNSNVRSVGRPRVTRSLSRPLVDDRRLGGPDDLAGENEPRRFMASTGSTAGFRVHDAWHAGKCEGR